MVKKFKIFAIIISMFIGTLSFAQLAEPGGGDGSTPGDSGIAGGGAPIGSGLLIVLGMGIAYGAKKTFQIQKDEEIV